MPISVLFVGLVPEISIDLPISEDKSPRVNLIARVSSEQEALRLIKEQQPDLLVLDISECEKISQSIFKKLRHFVFHLIVLYKNVSNSLPHSRFGATLHLPAPCDSSSIQEAVGQILELEKEEGSIEQRYQRLFQPLEIGAFLIIHIQSEEGPRFIWVSDIFLWTDLPGGLSELNMQDGSQIECLTSTKDYKQWLPKSFYRAKSKRFINLRGIRSLDEENCSVRMKNDVEVSLQVKEFQKLKEYYLSESWDEG